VVAPYLSEEEFRATVERLRDLRQAKKAWLLIGSGGASFAVLGKEADENLRERSGEVAEALDAAMTNQPVDHFASRRASPIARAFGVHEEPEDPEIAGRKLRIVSETFPIRELVRRRWLKRTSKTDSPGVFEWDIGRKHREDTLPIPAGGPVPYALIRFASSRPSGELPGARAHELQVTLDLEDVDYLIGTLADLRTELAKLSESGES
jgi:hypothetical protein